MSWDGAATTKGERARIRARVVLAVAVLSAGIALGLLLWADGVGRELQSRFGSAHRDRLIGAAPVLLEATLMSVDRVDRHRSVVSYEYFHGVELYVGYSVVPSERTLDWKRLGPLEIEVAAGAPDLSRPVGVVLAPNGWVSDGWDRSWPWLARAQLLLAGGLALVGITLWRRSG